MSDYNIRADLEELLTQLDDAIDRAMAGEVSVANLIHCRNNVIEMLVEIDCERKASE